jgi:hypothetical protein
MESGRAVSCRIHLLRAKKEKVQGHGALNVCAMVSNVVILTFAAVHAEACPVQARNKERKQQNIM